MNPIKGIFNWVELLYIICVMLLPLIGLWIWPSTTWYFFLGKWVLLMMGGAVLWIASLLIATKLFDRERLDSPK